MLDNYIIPAIILDVKTLKEVAGDYVIIASNSQGWGIGDSLQLAKANCRKATRRNPEVIGLLPKGSVVDALQVTYPKNAKFKMTLL